MPTAHASQIARMLRDIDKEYALTCGFTGRKSLPARIRQSFSQVPRHEFVPPELRSFAYEDHPLPIGQGQTISQPFIVALMTDLLNPQKTDRILEVGCGCGYQAAILSTLVAEVYSTEIIPGLAKTAEERLRDRGYNNIMVGEKDGYYGWPEHAPFDGIIVTAAAVTVPPPLVDQLQPGGRLVLPVGPPYGYQRLAVITKGMEEDHHIEEILGVAFVPLTGGHGDEE
ncbi:protein-L-isoaspartate(D-aspartate) O-methyltransferase [Thermodesulfobacteriota bacterium]